MSAKYAAGTVAMVTALNRLTPYRAFFDGQTWREVGDAVFCVDTPTAIRPLVVLDLGDERFRGWQIDVVLRHLRNPIEHCGGKGRPCPYATAIADQIEAQTVPPKPDEPTGLGAVVEDAAGERWVRKGNTEHGEDWARQIGNAWGGGGWDRIDAVRVLSEGWSA